VRYGSVCSGIEAATQAWHTLGWEPQFFAEIEPFPAAVLAHHYPDVINEGDFTTIGDKYDLTDGLLVGGTPCQDFSVAGLRAGLAGERGNLSTDFVKLAYSSNASWLLWENVPGVLSSGSGQDFAAILSGFTGCKIAVPSEGWKNAGIIEGAEGCFSVAWRVLDAQFVRVDGLERAVAQRRRRVFVVGHLGGWQYPAAVLFERASLQGHPAPSRKAGKGIAGDVEEGVTASSHGGYREGCGTLRSAEGDLGGGSENLAVDIPKVAPSLSASGTGTSRVGFNCEEEWMVPEVSHSLNARDYKGSRPEKDLGPPLIPQYYENHAQDNRVTGPHDVSETVSQKYGTGGGNTPLAAEPKAYCLQGGGATSQQSQGSGRNAVEKIRRPANDQSQPVRAGMQVRRLTPIECEFLMGFPRDYTKIPYRNNPADKCPDGPRYKALGNVDGGKLYEMAGN